ncbi:Bel1-like homeodomain protein [Thalictrum thalictroides]|uniref:Bel1-like homeodomain protein n=1 Tax=Thalictrum thalictroides TaxID=46969 RepID=A0A7J6X0C1_THATH|nr:Bel1-like homeodomain protein [Thalictrum thalictroides]
MAEGFLHHFPQQSRRDKLRVFLDNQQQQQQQLDGLLPSLIPSHMLRIRDGGGRRRGEEANANNNMHISSSYNHTNTTTTSSSSSSSSSSPSASHHHYPYMLDPSPSSSLPLPLNVYPSSLQDYNNFYIAQTLPEFDNSAAVGEALPINSSTMHMHMYKPQALSITNDSSSQRLSLSLSSHHQQQLNLARSNLGCSSSRGGGGASSSNDIRSAVPLGPFTGYSSILKRSRFLVPAQQMLEDFCDVGQGFYIDRSSIDSLTMEENFNETAGIVDNLMACSDRGEHHHQKKVRLITLLDEVYMILLLSKIGFNLVTFINLFYVMLSFHYDKILLVRKG